MIARLAVVTTLIALFALSFSVLADGAHQRSQASPMMKKGDDCLTEGLLCAPGSNVRG